MQGVNVGFLLQRSQQDRTAARLSGWLAGGGSEESHQGEVGGKTGLQPKALTNSLVLEPLSTGGHTPTATDPIRAHDARSMHHCIKHDNTVP